MEDKKKLISEFLNKGILISKDSIEKVRKEGLPEQADLLYVNEDLLNIFEHTAEINLLEFEKARAVLEKVGDEKSYNKFLNYFKDSPVEDISKMNVEVSFEEVSEKWEVHDFTMHFNSRLEMLQKILYSRDELKNTTSVNRVLAKRERENVALIGLVKEKKTTKNGNLMLELEDSTGTIKVLVNKNKPDLFSNSQDIVLDEVIGVSGVNGDKIVFANNVIWPDVPLTNELRKSNEEGYALFLSDLHVGSDNFLADDFNKFLAWINQKVGSKQQKDIASKVKYIFILGDLVDGVGVYPDQEKELVINDIYDQYRECTRLLKQIPDNMQLIICAGNHDALRIAEPQPPLTKEFCPGLHDMPNVSMVSNPAVVNIHSSKNFSGYKVLIYHGYSFDHYVANVDSIRNNGGYNNADLIMKFLLKRRHLAPTHASTLYVPYMNKDPLVIEQVPDFFVSGHIHKSVVAHYKNITLISGSCWQSKTPFQEKVGHIPEPGRVPIVDLATRKAKILRFGK